MLTEKQIKKRLNYVTASEIGAIVGVNPWDTPQDVYRRKCSLAVKTVDPIKTRRGHIMEGPLLDIASQELDIEIVRNTKMFVHPEHKLFAATPDGFDSLNRVDEAKHLGRYTAPKWADSVPHYVFCQVQWQMACCGKKQALVVSNPWGDIRFDVIDFNQDFFDAVANRAYSFWDCVQKRVLPEFGNDDIEDMLDDLNTTWVDQETDKIIIDNGNADMHKKLMEYDTIKKHIKTLSEAEKVLKTEIAEVIGENEGVQVDDILCAFKQGKDRKSVDWERIALELNASQEVIDKHTKLNSGFRTMRIKKVRYK